MFKSGDSHAVWTWLWTWKYFKWALNYLHDFYTESWSDWSFWQCFCLQKTLCTVITLWRCYANLKFTADAILFREIQCKKMDILMFWQLFWCKFSWYKVKYARKTITHVCFIALTLAGLLRRWLSTQPVGLVFKQLPPDLPNVNAWKKTCVIPIIQPKQCLQLTKSQKVYYSPFIFTVIQEVTWLNVPVYDIKLVNPF